MAVRKRPTFVLDQNFPNSDLLTTPFPDIMFVSIREVHPDLTAGHEDWQVLQQLYARGGADGFVTLDRNILSLPKEMVVLHQTRLALVVLLDTENDPIAAGGLLIAVAGRLARAFDRRKPQIFRVRLPQVASEPAWAAIGRIADKEHIEAKALVAREKISFLALNADDRADV